MLTKGGYFQQRPNTMLLVNFVALSGLRKSLKVEVVGTVFFFQPFSTFVHFLLALLSSRSSIQRTSWGHHTPCLHILVSSLYDYGKFILLPYKFHHI